MKKKHLGFIFAILLAAMGPVIVFAQDSEDYPPIITAVDIHIMRNQGSDFYWGPFDPPEVFDPATEIARVGDWIFLDIEVSDGDLPDDEIWVRKRSSFIWTWGYPSPEPGPVGGDTPYFRGPYGGGAGVAYISRDFQVPAYNGPNQARLRNPDTHPWDVRWSVSIEVCNSNEPGDDDPVDWYFFTLYAVEHPKFRPPNPPPFADAGADETVAIGDTVQLDGSRTFDGYNVGFDPSNPDVFEKDTLNYVWEWISGPQRIEDEDFTYPSPLTKPWLATVTLNAVGVYEFRLFVDDGVNPLPSGDTVVISVVPSLPTNHAPLAAVTAPTDPIVVGDTLTLDASASIDPDGDTLHYLWRQTDEVGGAIPPTEFASYFQPLGGLEQAVSSWQAIRAGTYYFLLLVDDGQLNDVEFVSVRVIDSASAGVSATANNSNEAQDVISGNMLPVSAACGGSLLPLAILPLLFCLMRGRIR